MTTPDVPPAAPVPTLGGYIPRRKNLSILPRPVAPLISTPQVVVPPVVEVTPPVTIAPPAVVVAPAAAPTARAARIPNGTAAPAGTDKWQHNNALALGVLTGNESAADRAKAIKAYMARAGNPGTDEAAFREQLRKDAMELQKKLQAQGLYNGRIDGMLGDNSARGIEQLVGKKPELQDPTKLQDFAREPAAAAPPRAAPPRAIPSRVPGM